MSNFATLLPLILLLLITYLLQIRPQKKREKEVNAMRSSVQVGDEIITIGGICGKVVKTKDESLRKDFANLTPNESKKLGRKVKLREDWEDVKVDIMYEIVKQKFIQNPDLKDKLIATGNAYLEEGNTWGDKVWGTVNGEGFNHLGFILMKIREELKES